MNKLFKYFLITIASIAGLFVFIAIIGIISCALDNGFSDEIESIPENLINKAKYGEKYPYTIDNLELKCEDNAVWVEDSSGNKYAINGLAYIRFTQLGEESFKGYTKDILKTNTKISTSKQTVKYDDAMFLDLGLQLCKR